MKVSVTTIALADLEVDLLLIPLPEGAAVSRFTPVFGDAVQRSAVDFSGAAEEVVLVYPDRGNARRIALLGLGDAGCLDAEQVRIAAAEGARVAQRCKAETVAFAVPEAALDAEAVCQALVEGFLLGGYRYTAYKTGEDAEAVTTQRLVLQSESQDGASRRGVDRGRILAEAVMFARDLVNLSPNDKTATLLARAIERAGKKHGYAVDVWDKAMIEEEGMGGLLAVNSGSVEPPTFTVMAWQPDNAVNERPVVLVGKGVVFDTGGLSLKPTKGSMDAMKSDMAGAAAVAGAMEALARLALPLYVIGLIPATDNRPGEKAYVPGDVIRMHSGKTVEVLNTDAEGRMILADALSYAKAFKPMLVIDLATLTGAAVIALGDRVAAVMTNETDGALDRLRAMEAAGDRSGDRVHRLPMYESYARQLKSTVADLKNIGGRAAGTITAAKFLEHFVDYPWIHLDIAGPSFLTESQPYRPVGGTGFGVRLLVEFLRGLAHPKKR